MKKIFRISILLTLTALMCLNVNAQQVETVTVRHGEVGDIEIPKPKKVKPAKTEFSREKGLLLRIDLGAQAILNQDFNAAGWNAFATVGYQLSPMISVGAGIGYFMNFTHYSKAYYLYNNDYNISHKHITTKPINSLPIYLNARVHFTQNRCQPFLDLKLGYMAGLNTVVTDCSVRYTSTGNYYANGTGASFWDGFWDSWHQYDTYSKMRGFYASLAFGLSIENFDICIEASPVWWLLHQEKVYHKEFRPNGLPDWEYEQTVAQRNTTQSLMKSENYHSLTGLIGLKIAYTIPFKNQQ